AVHIARSELLRKGYTLTQATRIVKNAFNIKAEILPACEENVQTYIKTSDGMMHFQEFWVLKKGKLDVEDIVFKGIGKAVATDDVFRAMETSDAIVVGPSNPITSIMPIISVKGIKRMLKKKFVVAVSPIIGKKPVSGPAAKLMKAKGFEVSADGVADCYSDFLDLIVVHSGDRCNYKYVETDIVMRDKKDEIRLAKFIVDLVKKYI
ncbi:MAG: 2-phospho-L-lactate transferase, partial [Archaeoglobus sp.]